MSKSSLPSGNLLLSLLSPGDQNLLQDGLERVELPQKLTVYSSDEPIDYVYFPESGVGSLIATMADGARVEVGMAGREGMMGLPVILNRTVSPTDAEIQLPGRGLRLSARKFRKALDESPTLRALMLSYVSTFLDQVTQTASCNRYHVVEERLARWLLMSHDRIDGDELPLTHEYLSTMLGVRRAGVTVAAGILAKADLISYRAGHVTVINRRRLEEAGCECYAVVDRRFSETFGNEIGQLGYRSRVNCTASY